MNVYQLLISHSLNIAKPNTFRFNNNFTKITFYQKYISYAELKNIDLCIKMALKLKIFVDFLLLLIIGNDRHCFKCLNYKLVCKIIHFYKLSFHLKNRHIFMFSAYYSQDYQILLEILCFKLKQIVPLINTISVSHK